MPGPTVVVTDSTASLPGDVASARGIVVVPLEVVIGATVYDEGPDGATPEMVAQALKDFRPVSTSRPSPARLLEVYAQAAADGADEILSIHLSAEMSGTYESAQLAAREAPVPVTVVDSRQVGVATGLMAALSFVFSDYLTGMLASDAIGRFPGLILLGWAVALCGGFYAVAAYALRLPEIDRWIGIGRRVASRIGVTRFFRH